MFSENQSGVIVIKKISFGMSSALIEVLCGQVFDFKIFPHLKLSDVLRISLVCRATHARFDKRYFSKCAANKIVSILKHMFGEHYKDFVAAMVASRAVIGGSFLIQCILSEFYPNSDIDIYVKEITETKSNKCSIVNFLKNFTHFFNEGVKKNDNYKKDLLISNVSNYNIMCEDGEYFDGISMPRTIKSNRAQQHFPLPPILKKKLDSDRHDENGWIPYGSASGHHQLIQVVEVITNQNYTLWKHIQKTGFEMCKNMAYYNKDKKLVVVMSDHKQIIKKCTKFTIIDTDDFEFRLQKYSERGFYFLVERERLLYLEFMLLKNFKFRSINIKFAKDQRAIANSCEQCTSKCPLALLFREVKHSHTNRYDSHSVFSVIIESHWHLFEKLLPDMLRYSLLETNGREDKYEHIRTNVKFFDDYLKMRNHLSGKSKTIATSKTRNSHFIRVGELFPDPQSSEREKQKLPTLNLKIDFPEL